MKLYSNWQRISEIPPGPPLTKGGWGDFRGIHPYPNMPLWFSLGRVRRLLKKSFFSRSGYFPGSPLFYREGRIHPHLKIGNSPHGSHRLWSADSWRNSYKWEWGQDLEFPTYWALLCAPEGPSGLFSPNRCKLVFMRKLPLLLRERGGVRGNRFGDNSSFLIRGEAVYFSMECGPRTHEPLSGRSLR